MKIDEMKINSYGKLHEKEIKLDNGINIIFGENEQGKSTLLNFIVNMFYGTSRNKKGKDISDFEKYKPWNTEEFSGKIKYTLDNNQKYEVFREFNKKNPKIYNSSTEDVTKNYSIDKNLGSQFFLEQTNVDEQTFTSTFVSFQNEVEIDGQTQNILLQKIANTSSTGDDNISYKKAIEKLNKKQLEEIGTMRSQEKPINIVINELKKLNDENESLKKYENYKYEIEEKKYNIENEIRNLNSKYEVAKKITNINQEEQIEKEKLKYNEEKIDELEENIEKLLQKKEEIYRNKRIINENKNVKVNIIPYIFIIIIGIVIGIAGSIFKYYITLIPTIISMIIFAIGINKIKKTKLINITQKNEYEKMSNENNEIEKKIYEINGQIDLLEKSRANQINETEQIKNKILKDINIKKDNIRMYSSNIDITELNKLLNSNNIQYELEVIQNNINQKNMELHRLILDKENIMPKIEQLAQNEEKIIYNSEIYQDLKKKNDCINLAKQYIDIAYQKMKNSVTPKFTDNLSKNISSITNNRYNKIKINEDDGILVELGNGEYKNANRLSKGTIQQLYLAFRLSMIEDIAQENMPIILDEIFAYYDNKRMNDTLKNIYEKYGNTHQIILFSCTEREEMALKDLKINFNKVVL